MPITRELENLEKFESAGFNHEQAKTLADVIEKSHVESQDDLKEFFRNELSKQITGLDNKLSNKISGLDSKLSKEISSLEVRLMASQKDMLIKILGIVVGTVGMAVTILKLFP